MHTVLKQSEWHTSIHFRTYDNSFHFCSFYHRRQYDTKMFPKSYIIIIYNYPQCLWLCFEKSFKTSILICYFGPLLVITNNIILFHLWIYLDDNCSFVSWHDLAAFHSWQSFHLQLKGTFTKNMNFLPSSLYEFISSVNHKIIIWRMLVTKPLIVGTENKTKIYILWKSMATS